MSLDICASLIVIHVAYFSLLRVISLKKQLQFVSEFRYLGHRVTDIMSDDDDIKLEIHNYVW